jgi:formate dehydrogenase assembly factor FdhD
MTGSSKAVDISKVSGDQSRSENDEVAVEEPLEIQLSSPTAEGSAAKSISITMRTPGEDAELATSSGWSFARTSMWISTGSSDTFIQRRAAAFAARLLSKHCA